MKRQGKKKKEKRRTTKKIIAVTFRTENKFSRVQFLELISFTKGFRFSVSGGGGGSFFVVFVAFSFLISQSLTLLL